MAKNEDKRQPTIADQFVTSPQPGGRHGSFNMIQRKMVDHVVSRVQAARRFVFDTKGSERLAEVIRDIPNLILREQKFARAPYDVTFVEFDYLAFWTILNQNKTPAHNIGKRVGFLIDHETAYVIGQHGLMPICYDLHQPWELSDQVAFCNKLGTSRLQLDMFLWGSSYRALGDSEQRSLRAHHSARILPLTKLYDDRAVNIGSVTMSESNSDLRNIIAVLLMLNRPSVTRYVQELPQTRSFVKGKFRPYLSHTVVTIDVDARPILRKIGTDAENDVEKRRHEVRGTWCHDAAYRAGRDRNCLHDWVPHPKYALDEHRVHFDESGRQERDNWFCKHCQGHRWWRDEHVRGNSLTGYVDKEYVATTR